MRKIIFGLFFIMLFSISSSFANGAYDESLYEQKPVTSQFVRVGISDNGFSNYLFDKVSFYSEGAFVVSDNLTFEKTFDFGSIASILFKNGYFEVYENSNRVLKTKDKLFIIPISGEPIGIYGLKRKGKPALYSGNFELEQSFTKPDRFAIVNVLPLQTYLKGVVPNEMPVKFGFEALKAQAVLARNYVLKPRENFYKEFDICDSTACQVYFGANTQDPLSDKAVDETENIVVLYDNELILAVYSSTSGGHTETYKNVFMQNLGGRLMAPNVPYLIGVPDNENLIKDGFFDNEERIREFYFSSPETFDNNSPYFRWKAEWLLADLEKILTRTLRTVKNTGFVKTKYPTHYDNDSFLGHIKSIYVNKRGVSGKIVALTLVTDKNEFTIFKELIIRKVFQYNNKLLPSANVFFDFVEDNNGIKLIATGGGLGHGVGMSQWGAGAMAKEGYKFDDIIHHYYTGVEIAVKPLLVKYGSPVSYEFFLDTKKADLLIENNIPFSDLDIIINDRYLENDFKNKFFEKKSMDISKYLKRGKNKIFCEIKDENLSKEVKVWIRVKE